MYRTAYNTAVVIQVLEHWQEQEIAQWVHDEGSIPRTIDPHVVMISLFNMLLGNTKNVELFMGYYSTKYNI